MKNELTKEEIRKGYEEINELLKNESLLETERKALEERKIILAVIDANRWLPMDSGRKIIMLIILVIGILGAVAGNGQWLFILLALPFFSPKILMNLLIVFGKIKGNK